MQNLQLPGLNRCLFLLTTRQSRSRREHRIATRLRCPLRSSPPHPLHRMTLLARSHRCRRLLCRKPSPRSIREECDVIAFEDLTHIRNRTGATWGHKWAFRTLYEQVEYKAEAEGISVKQVGSAYTSKRCAECGFTAEENRPTRNDFQCVKSESEANADYNAAKNIGMRYVRRG